MNQDKQQLSDTAVTVVSEIIVMSIGIAIMLSIGMGYGLYHMLTTN